jgi:5-formyltetrahydrofolate cyclo-ligase
LEALVDGMGSSDDAAPDLAATQDDPSMPHRRLAERKSRLRKELLAARASMSVADRRAAGRALRDTLLNLPELGMSGTVAAYLSVGAEPETTGLVYALWKRGTYVLLPVLLPDMDLDWASYEGPDSLRSGSSSPYGLLEPAEPPRGRDAIRSADLVIVPALAADRLGNRLGRGGGCYDRALARVAPSVPTIALLYDNELLDEVPAGAFDQRVRSVAQPGRGITRLG